MAKTKISVFLIKEGCTFRDAIEGLHPQNLERSRMRHVPQSVSVPEVGTLYYSTSSIRKPSWLDSFFGNSVDADPFSVASSSAVLLTNVDDRIMAITFGYGRNILDLSAIEPRFGLKVVLNSSADSVFRKVNTTSVAGNAGKNATQLPRLSLLTDFEIDSMIDTLDKVDARLESDELFEGSITGGDSLSFSTDADVRTIKSVLRDILIRYKSDIYKKNYKWVDNVSQVKDKNLLRRLEERAIELIVAKDACLWTAPAEMIESWDAIRGFKWSGCDELQPDILIEELLASFRKPLDSYQQLEKKIIEAIGTNSGDQAVIRWNMARCLYGELDLDEKHYCVNAGRWYEINRKYADQINDGYANALTYDGLPFPACIGLNEGNYNRVLAASDETSVLMDAKIIRYGLRYSSIELCDVLRGNDTFIHVKHYTSSANLSHLFFQGLNSATLVKSDRDFVDKANEVISEQEESTKDNVLSQANVKQVIYGIICKRHDGPLPNIPFFSRISFLEVSRRLQAMGIDCRICAIHEVNAAS